MACIAIPCKHCGAFEIRSEIYYVCFKCGQRLDSKIIKSEEPIKEISEKKKPVKKESIQKDPEPGQLW